MKKKIVIYITIAALIGAFGYYRISASRQHKFTEVKAATIKTGDIQSSLSTTGTIKSKSSKEYYGVQAKVKEVKVKVGDQVKKGDVLVTYEVQDFNTTLKQAQIQYDNAVLQRQDLRNQNSQINDKVNDVSNQIADIDNQISKLEDQLNKLKSSKDPSAAVQLKAVQDSYSVLVQQKSSLQAKKDALQPISSEKMKQQDNAIALAQLNLNAAKDNAAKNKDSIVADQDGTVTAVNVTVGAMGNIGQPAVVVQDLNNLKLLVSLGKYDADKVKVGDDAVIKNNGKEYKGKVSSMNPVAQKTMGTGGSDTVLPVEIDVLDKPDGLRVDFDTDVDILLGKASNVVTAPAEAIVTDKNGNSYVYVIEGDKAEEKPVKLGLQSDLEVQIASGAKTGDKIILNPSSSIKDGTLVKDASEAKK